MAAPDVAPLTRAGVLDELEFLATVEHALIVEYLSVACAFGAELDPSTGIAVTEEGSEVAATGTRMAMSQMYTFRRVTSLLVAAGRSARTDRAAAVAGTTVAQTSLDPPTAAQLADLATREETIAAAVDERYRALAPAVTTDPVFDPDLLDIARDLVVDDGPSHAAAAAGLRVALNGRNPADLLRATRRESDDLLEQRLLDAADRAYGILRQLYVPDDVAPFGLRQTAVSTMGVMDGLHAALGQRGLLPRFYA